MANTTKQLKADPAKPAKQAKDAEPAAAPPGKNRKRLKLLLVLVLALLLGAAGGGWYFLADESGATPPKPGTAKAAPAKAASLKPPVFVPLEPFTVNLLHQDDSSQYLQVGLSIKLNGAETADAIKLRMPEIRNRVLLLLSNKKASDIDTLEGKKMLSLELTREISQPLAGSVPAGALDSVLFTSFVIQ